MGSRPCATQKLENPSLGGEAVKPLPTGIEKWDTAGIFCSFLHCYIFSQTQTAPGTQYVLSENSIVNESLHKKMDCSRGFSESLASQCIVVEHRNPVFKTL